MDFTTKQWLIGVILVVIVVILIDGFRRMQKARKDSLHMALDVKNTYASEADRIAYGSEFPNGGARLSQKEIDRNRIKQVKSQYDFGRDLSDCLKKPLISKAKQETHPLKTELDVEVIDDQWVDDDEGDEEYYARKWDDEDESSYELGEELDDDFDSKRDPRLAQPMDEDKLTIDASESEPSISIDSQKGLSNDLNEDDIDDAPQPTKVAKPQTNKNPLKKEYLEPQQASLNLEESVPMLMEAVEEDMPKIHLDVDDADVSSSEDAATVAIRSVGKRVEPTIGNEEVMDTHSANKPRYESKYFSSKQPQTHQVSPNEVLVVNIKAPDGYEFQGADLLEQVLENGLRYGAMNIFHHHSDEDGEGPILFSMANMLKPGIFDLKTIDTFTTAGVTFFLTLPVANNHNMAAFETMVATAKNMAKALGGELKDEHRSVMTAQTIEHYRERIRDFTRRQQLEKRK
jgi:cell division protein ZipA